MKRFWVLLIGLSALTSIISLAMILPLIVSFLCHESFLIKKAFFLAIFSSLTFSLLIFFSTRPFFRRLDAKEQNLSIKEGALLVTLGWVLVSIVSAIPFFESRIIPSFTDAFFEVMSGYTTTGATILKDIEVVPHSLLFWRAETHWLGGMGIIMLVVALFPLLGIGSFQLMKAEAPGPEVDRLTYRISHTAKILWVIYVSLTALEIILLLLGHMSLFDAVTHSFATMATGGFSTKNSSITNYSPYIQWIITLFMFLAGVNFIIFFQILLRRWRSIWINSEFRMYLFIVLLAISLITISLLYNQVYPHFSDAVRQASFQVLSILSTTGFATADYDIWPNSSKIVLLLLMFIGGCAGSTAGGIKVIRIVVILKKAIVDLLEILNPRSIHQVRLNRHNFNHSKISPIIGFFIVYSFIIALVVLITGLFGYDPLTSLSVAYATLGNIGPGFGNIGPTLNFAHFPDALKWFYSFIMLIGRLELFTVLVLFLPRFWRKF